MLQTEKRVQINFRLPKGILAKLDKYASKQYQDRTTALISILHKELEAQEPVKQEVSN